MRTFGFKLLVNVIAILAMILSCDKVEQGGTNGGATGEGELTKLKGVTLTLEKINATTAYFTGVVKQMTPDLIVGIHWDYDPIEHISNTTLVRTTDFYEGGKFLIQVNSLPSNETIYYMPYVFRNGIAEYGDCLSFKTPQVTMTIEKVEVNGLEAVFKGVADLDGEGGILVSTNSQLSLNNYMNNLKVVPDEVDKKYEHRLVDLSRTTTYYYRSYYYDRGQKDYVYGNVNSFTTGKDPAEKDLSLSSAEDLSKNGAANCYIVSQAGIYKIRTVKGNDNTQVLANAFSPSVLWESFGTDETPSKLDLINGVCYKDGYLIFETSSAFREGNAVIAIKDEDGTILWSWHIWMTDQPQVQKYFNAAIMMDRNLGATSATPGDVGALGLLYQWGRKDPFLNADSISSYEEAKSTLSWPSPVSADTSTGNIDYVISHPTSYVTGHSRSYDWHLSGGRDNSLWTTSSTAKSIYDPCPTGWRVPDGGSNGVWAIAGFGSTDYDSTNQGMSFSVSSSDIAWYPASGYRFIDAGGISDVGDCGSYWSASTKDDVAYYLRFYKNGGVYTSSSSHRACGASVRCIKE